MVQEFHVLRCFSCRSFQVQQVKKVNKWRCKLCGEKQSLLKEFGRGSGANCRHHVQKLNATRGATMEAQGCAAWSLCTTMEDEEEEQSDSQVRPTRLSRWNKYLDTPEEAEPKQEEMLENVLMSRQHFNGDRMIDRKRRRSKEEPDQRSSQTHEQCLRQQLHTPAASTHSQTPPSASAAGQPAGGATSCSDISPLFVPPSMFQSGEDFSFDDDFLTEQKV